jgi:RNA polymerase sigma-70 factor (ECF subfamily)
MDRISGRTWWSEARAIAARLARRGASDAAEDLAQDLAVRALEEGPAVDRPGAWLERVGRNRFIDGRRGEQRRDELAPAVEPPAAPRDPEAQLMARERSRAVRRALLTLPRPQRRAALLRFHGDLPFEAVAARLGTEPATARTRVHRALAELRARMQGLRALFVGWQGAQTAALGLALAGAAGFAPPASDEARPATAATAPAPASRRALPRPAPAADAPAAPPQAPPAPRPSRLRAAVPEPLPPLRQEFHFGDDIIAGTLYGPEGEPVVGPPPIAPQPSLIEIRRDLLPEIVKSLEEL